MFPSIEKLLVCCTITVCLLHCVLVPQVQVPIGVAQKSATISRIQPKNPRLGYSVLPATAKRWRISSEEFPAIHWRPRSLWKASLHTVWCRTCLLPSGDLELPRMLRKMPVRFTHELTKFRRSLRQNLYLTSNFSLCTFSKLLYTSSKTLASDLVCQP